MASPRNLSGWSIDTYAAYGDALRLADQKFQDERDRRYAEVKFAEEKALRVKEQADRVALDLARQIQTYKDEQANQLREQINSERGLYATKDDLQAVVDKVQVQLSPMQGFMASQQGLSTGMATNRSAMMSFVALIVGLITIGTFVFVTLRTPAVPLQQPQVIYVPAPPGALLPSTPPQPAPR